MIDEERVGETEGERVNVCYSVALAPFSLRGPVVHIEPVKSERRLGWGEIFMFLDIVQLRTRMDGWVDDQSVGRSVE